MKVIATFLCLIVSGIGLSQELSDVSGKWAGTLSFLAVDSKLEIDLDQSGNQLSGFLYIRSMDEQDSAKKKLNGLVEGNNIQFKEIAYEYKTSGFCLANFDLKLATVGSTRKLEGKWKGDLSFKTCPPGTSGPVVLYQEERQSVVSSEEPVTSVSTKTVTDDLGDALVRELSQRSYYALIIGIDDYQDTQITSLDQPVADAKKLFQVLNKAYSFEEENVTFLRNPTRSEIINSLDRLAQKVTEKDNLLIFYAGHGIWDEQLNQGYWLPADAQKDSKSFWLSNSTLRDYIGGIPSKHTLLISDACFSGGIFKERSIQSSRAMLELYKLPSRKAMTSGTMTTVPDKSVFIKYLVKHLEENDLPLLSADQLFRHFKIAVIHNSPNGQVPQYGAISQTGDEGGDFIFLRKE